MKTAAILYPIIALALWTLLVLAIVPVVRIRAAVRQEVKADDFRYGESSSVPAVLTLQNRNYMNLLELPVLFYVICLIAYITGSVSPLIVGLAWCFVGARIVHSAIHLSYNNVLHRLAAFAAGVIALVLLIALVARAIPWQ